MKTPVWAIASRWLIILAGYGALLLALQGCAAGLIIGYLAAKSEQPAAPPAPTVVISK